MPDFSKLIVAEGNLFEPPQTPISHYSYNPKNGNLKVEWDTKTWKDGHPDDIAHLVASYWTPPNFKINPKPWKLIKV